MAQGKASKRGGVRSQAKHRNKNLPPRADNAFGINGFKYKTRSDVLILCKDEKKYRQVIERLHAALQDEHTATFRTQKLKT